VCATFQDLCSYQIIRHVNLYTLTRTQILYEAKAKQAKGKILSVELFGLKLLAKLKYDINEIWRIALVK